MPTRCFAPVGDDASGAAAGLLGLAGSGQIRTTLVQRVVSQTVVSVGQGRGQEGGPDGQESALHPRRRAKEQEKGSKVLFFFFCGKKDGLSRRRAR